MVPVTSCCESGARVLNRTLVSPSNPGQISAACQVACRTSGVLHRLEDILLASGIPADVLTETINTLGRTHHRLPYPPLFYIILYVNQNTHFVG